MKVAVFGAISATGLLVVERLLECGHEVRPSYATLSPSLTAITLGGIAPRRFGVEPRAGQRPSSPLTAVRRPQHRR
jgi:hypothetical protein